MFTFTFKGLGRPGAPEKCLPTGAKYLNPALPQLHPCSIEETREIASVRIHVERIIGLTRFKF